MLTEKNIVSITTRGLGKKRERVRERERERERERKLKEGEREYKMQRWEGRVGRGG